MANAVVPVCLAVGVGAAVIVCTCGNVIQKIVREAEEFFANNRCTNVQQELEKEARVWNGDQKAVVRFSFPGWPTEPMDRPKFWETLLGFGLSSPGLLDLLGGIPLPQRGVAVDLGSGLSQTAVQLLNHDWRVHCVDYSPKILEILKRSIQESFPREIAQQLITCCEKIEDYRFPSQVDLITATSSLTYCNPSKINAVLQNIFQSLKPGGYFVGNFFCSKYSNAQQKEGLRTMGAWLLKNETSVNELLSSVGFQVVTLQHGGEANPGSAVFICKKP